MSIKQRLYYNVCSFIFKAVNGMLPKQLKEQLELVGKNTDRQTRQAGDIAIQFRRTRSAQKSMFYEGVKMFNALPAEIKRCKKLEAFKRVLKEYVLSTI